VSTDRELHVRVRAETLRKEVLRGSGLRSQHIRLDTVVLRQLGYHVVLVDHNHGDRLGLQRRPGVLVHRRDLRTQTPRNHGMRGKHGVSDRRPVQLRAELRFPLEDCGRDERPVSGHVSDVRGICENILNDQFLLISSIVQFTITYPFLIFLHRYRKARFGCCPKAETKRPWTPFVG